MRVAFDRNLGMRMRARMGVVPVVLVARGPPLCKATSTVPANQRAGTDRLAESGCLLNDRRAGQASSGGWAAWNPADRECLLHISVTK